MKALNPATLSDSQRNVRDNAMLFLQHLQKLTEAQRLALAQFVINHCFLVVVSTPDLDSAYRIFSVLNDRGLDLSHTDILKAEIIGRIPTQQQDKYTEKWEEIIGMDCSNLGEVMGRMLWHQASGEEKWQQMTPPLQFANSRSKKSHTY